MFGGLQPSDRLIGHLKCAECFACPKPLDRGQQLEESSRVSGGEPDEPRDEARALALAFEVVQRVEHDPVADPARQVLVVAPSGPYPLSANWSLELVFDRQSTCQF